MKQIKKQERIWRMCSQYSSRYSSPFIYTFVSKKHDVMIFFKYINMNLTNALEIWSEEGGGPKMNKDLQYYITKHMTNEIHRKPLYRGMFVDSKIVQAKEPRVFAVRTLQSWSGDVLTAKIYATQTIHGSGRRYKGKTSVVFFGTKGLSKVRGINLQKHFGQNHLNEIILDRPYFRAHFENQVEEDGIVYVPVHFYGSSKRNIVK